METCCQKSAKNAIKPKTKWLAYVYLLPVYFYRYFVSPLIGPRCRFEPSCSYYAEQSILTHGIVKGSWLAIKRLSKCHPWHSGGYDPVPERPKN